MILVDDIESSFFIEGKEILDDNVKEVVSLIRVINPYLM